MLIIRRSIIPLIKLSDDERRRIGNEFHRFFDLVRTNRAMEVINSKGFNLTKDKLLFPIPECDRY